MFDFDAELVHRIPILRKFAWKLCRGHRADDLVQDTIVRCLEKQHLFQPGTNLTRWCCAIMFNTNVNHVRKAMRHPSVAIGVDGIDPGYRPTQLESVYLMELNERIGDALDALPAAQHRAITMIAAGYDYDSVAKMEGVPTGTIRSRLSRGRDTARAMVRGREA